jgi:DNA-binding transcriptional MerR regulator
MPDQPNLLTLSEVSKRTKISMPTLQRYKKLYQRRIPSVGKGRKQRYPVEALEVFQVLKTKNLAKRGRRKSAAKRTGPGRKAGATKLPRRGRRAASAKSGGLVTLKEVERRTGISYPTLLRYVDLHGTGIPHEGEGRRRRFHPEAVEVFKELRSQSGGRGRGGRKTAGRRRTAASAGGSLAQRVKALENAQSSLERQIRAVLKQLRKPVTVTLARTR